MTYRNITGELTGKQNIIPINVIFIDFCGGYGQAAILTQLLYWCPRAVIRIDNKAWIAKTYDDWYKEIRVKEQTVRRFLKVLKEQGFIETKIKKFNGSPTAHIHVKPELEDAIFEYIQIWRDFNNVESKRLYACLEPYKMSDWNLTKWKERPLQNVRLEPSTMAETLTEPTAKPTTENITEKKRDSKKNLPEIPEIEKETALPTETNNFDSFIKLIRSYQLTEPTGLHGPINDWKKWIPVLRKKYNSDYLLTTDDFKTGIKALYVAYLSFFKQSGGIGKADYKSAYNDLKTLFEALPEIQNGFWCDKSYSAIAKHLQKLILLSKKHKGNQEINVDTDKKMTIEEIRMSPDPKTKYRYNTNSGRLRPANETKMLIYLYDKGCLNKEKSIKVDDLKAVCEGASELLLDLFKARKVRYKRDEDSPDSVKIALLM